MTITCQLHSKTQADSTTWNMCWLPWQRAKGKNGADYTWLAKASLMAKPDINRVGKYSLCPRERHVYLQTRTQPATKPALRSSVLPPHPSCTSLPALATCCVTIVSVSIILQHWELHEAGIMSQASPQPSTLPAAEQLLFVWGTRK